MHPDAPDDDPRKSEAIALLAMGYTGPEVAEKLEVSRWTIWRWRQDPEFAARVASIREKVQQDVHDRLLVIAPRAVEALAEEIVKDDGGGTRIAAARTILDRVAPATTKQDVHVTSKMSEEEIRAKLEAMGWRKT